MLTLTRRYTMPDEEALARLHALSDYWAARHGLLIAWEGQNVHLTGKVLGVRFDGRVVIGDGALEATVKAGFLAEKLGGKAYVARKLDDYLDPQNSVASLEARIPS